MTFEDRVKIDKLDLENIIISTEIHIKEYMKKMEYLGDILQK